MVNELTHERLIKLLDYNASTGEWRWSPGRKGRQGSSKAGGIGSDGIVRIKIDRKTYHAHVLSYYYMTGKLPPESAGPANGDYQDLRYGNVELRAYTKMQRSMLKGAYNPNRLPGVTPCSHGGKYRATISIRSTKIDIGRYVDVFDAFCARKSAENRKKVIESTPMFARANP